MSNKEILLNPDIALRDVEEADLDVFFEQQLDADANYMAAFTAKDPSDRGAFMERWARIMGDDAITKNSVVADGVVVGHVAGFERDGLMEVTYWIGRRYWGKGYATKALSLFLRELKVRPLYARAAKDNLGSIRVLEKCGFKISGQEKGYANARGREIQEIIMVLR